MYQAEDAKDPCKYMNETYAEDPTLLKGLLEHVAQRCCTLDDGFKHNFQNHITTGQIPVPPTKDASREMWLMPWQIGFEEKFLDKGAPDTANLWDVMDGFLEKGAVCFHRDTVPHGTFDASPCTNQPNEHKQTITIM